MSARVSLVLDLILRTTSPMAKLTALATVTFLLLVGVFATSDKPEGINIIPQDVMACGSSPRTRLGAY